MTSEWPPQLPTLPISRTEPTARLVRLLLAEAGGLASARHLRDAVVQTTGASMSIRRIRDLLRSPEVRQLGAGYFATRETIFEPVLDFSERLLEEESRMTTAALTDAILRRYPRGDAVAIRRWIQQDPGRLQHDDGRVRLTPRRWRTP